MVVKGMEFTYFEGGHLLKVYVPKGTGRTRAEMATAEYLSQNNLSTCQVVFVNSWNGNLDGFGGWPREEGWE